jgi:hypothetical protein
MEVNNINAVNVYKKLYKNNLKTMESLAIARKLVNMSSANKPVEIHLDKINKIVEFKYNILSSSPTFKYSIKYHKFGFDLGSVNLDDIGRCYDLFKKYFINMPESHYELFGAIQLTTRNENEKLNFIMEYIDRLYQFKLEEWLDE